MSADVIGFRFEPLPPADQFIKMLVRVEVNGYGVDPPPEKLGVNLRVAVAVSLA